MSLLDKATLIVTPTGYSKDFLHCVKPNTTDGDFDFVRSTGSFRTNSAGLLDDVPYNRVTYSNDFTPVNWSKFNATVTSGQADRSGGTNAWLIAKTGAAGRCEQNISDRNSSFQTASVYAKAGTLNFLYLRVNQSTSRGAYFDLSNGTVGSTGANIVSAAITAAGNGYYRCEVRFNANLTAVGVIPVDSDGGYTNANTGNIYAQDVQLENATSATTYVATTNRENLPVIDYISGAGHIALQPTRQNLFSYGNSLETNWSSSGTNPPTLTAKQFTSPDGRTNASRLEFPNTATASALQQGFTHINNFRHAISIYAKSNTGSNQTFRLFGDDASVSAISSVFTATSEWQRFTFYFSASSTGTKQAGIYHDAGTSSDLQIFGMMVERGGTSTNFSASGYIPTGNQTETRSLDRAHDAGVGASGIFNDSEGVLYGEIATDHDQSFRSIAISDGSLSNCVRMQFNTTLNQINLNIRAATATSLNYTHTLTDASAFNKIAISYKVNDFKVYINGTLVNTDTSGTTPTGLDRLSFANYYNSSTFYGRCKMLAVFDEQLTTDELECLTTP